MVPFENSSNGSVIYTLDLFADRQALFPSITVVDEVYLDIHHYLLGHKESSHPPTIHQPSEGSVRDEVCGLAPSLSSSDSGAPTRPPSTLSRTQPVAPLNHITRIYSHPQAFGQCEHFLRAYLPHASYQEVTSTSAAALLVAQDKTGTSAAIASLIAAGAHGLEVLGKEIEDREDNRTRFLVLRHSHADVGLRQADIEASNRHEHYKTLVSFTIDHLRPGALVDALMVFKTHSLNLTSINSRPSRVWPWHYIFFVEFEGRKGWNHVDTALDELGRTTEGWRWLGSWRDRKQ